MRTASAFPIGLALAAHKRQALQSPLENAAPPAIAIVALDQGNGRAALPSVSQGDHVRLGQPIAIDAETRYDVVHAPVAGKVLAIESRPDGSEAGHGPCVAIENDGSDSRDADIVPLDGLESTDPESLLARIANAGIVGLGGAAFPSAVKLAAARARGASHLVLNGAECEPWICCDDALMRARAPRIVQGARLLLRATGATRCTIAVEDDKPEAIAALAQALSAASDDRIELRTIVPVYPAGAERQLLAAITGVEVPSGRLPSDAGLLCHNVGTAAAVAEFAETGLPCLRRVVTITGSGVARPGNLDAWIGTPIAELIAQRGGYVDAPERLIAGGTLTGRALPSDEAGLTKAMNCLIAATAIDLAPRGDEAPCIRCGDCASVCPAGLLPQQLHRAALADDPESLAHFGLLDCIECGCCDYVCPSRIPLTARFRVAKARQQLRDGERPRAAEARVRFERHEQRRLATADAERRAFDDARRQARGLDERGS